MANTLVPVTFNIKVLVNLKLQPRIHTGTLIVTSIHLMYLMIHFLCRKLKKKKSICKVFSNLTFIYSLLVLQLQKNPLCTCTLEVESTTHFSYSLHCHYYNNIHKTLLDDLKVINVNVLKLSETALTDLLLYGEARFDKIQNKMILSVNQIYNRF